jgi:hypothetical protein
MLSCSLVALAKGNPISHESIGPWMNKVYDWLIVISIKPKKVRQPKATTICMIHALHYGESSSKDTFALVDTGSSHCIRILYTDTNQLAHY